MIHQNQLAKNRNYSKIHSQLSLVSQAKIPKNSKDLFYHNKNLKTQNFNYLASCVYRKNISNSEQKF